MANLPGLIVKISADTRDAAAALNRIDGKMNSFANTMKGLGIAVAAAFSVRAIADFAADSIRAASDMQEAMSKAEVVFGDAAIAVKQFSDDSVTSLGLSSGAALEAAGTFGNLLVSFGVGQSKAAEMSTTLVQLAADLASFNNTSVEQALNALRSGLSGETEPLKRFGIVLQDTRLRAEAAALGIETTAKSLDPLTKSMAAYSLIMKDSATAQGDFARTSDGLANTQRILSAAVQDAKEEIGIGFLRAIESVSQAFGGPDGMANAIAHVADETSLLIEGFAILTGEIKKFDTEVNRSNQVMIVAARNYEKGGKGVLGWADAVVSANMAGQNMFQAILTGTQAIAFQERNTEAAAEAQRLLEAGYRANSRALPDVTAKTYAYAGAIKALVGSFGQGDAVAARTARNMDSFGRQVDKSSVYWSNAADEAGAYFKSLEKGGGGGGSADKAKDKLKELELALTDVNGANITYTTEYEKLSKKRVAVLEAEQRRVQSVIDGQLEKIEFYQAKIKEYNDFIDDVGKKATGGLDLGDFIVEVKDDKGKVVDTFFDALGFDNAIANRAELLDRVTGIASQIPQAWADSLLTLPTDKANLILDYFTNNADTSTALVKSYTEFTAKVVDTWGPMLADAYGVMHKDAAAEGIRWAKYTIQEEAAEFKKFVRSKLKTRVVIEIEYKEINSPPAAAASGGAVRQVQQFEALNGRSWRV